MTRTFRVSHRKLVASFEFLEIVVDALSALEAAESRLNVEHSGGCCELEPWAVTAERLTETMAQRRHRETVHVLLASEL